MLSDGPKDGLEKQHAEEKSYFHVLGPDHEI